MNALPAHNAPGSFYGRATLRGGHITMSAPVPVPQGAKVDWTMIGCGLPGYEGLSVAQYAGLVMDAAALGDLRWVEYYAAHARAHGAFDAIAESMSQQARPKKSKR